MCQFWNDQGHFYCQKYENFGKFVKRPHPIPETSHIDHASYLLHYMNSLCGFTTKPYYYIHLKFLELCNTELLFGYLECFESLSHWVLRLLQMLYQYILSQISYLLVVILELNGVSEVQYKKIMIIGDK